MSTHGSGPASGEPDHTEKFDAIMAFLRPSPMEFAGVVTGGTIGAYTAGPFGALAGMVIGGTLFSLAERAIDRQAPSVRTPKQ